SFKGLCLIGHRNGSFLRKSSLDSPLAIKTYKQLLPPVKTSCRAVTNLLNNESVSDIDRLRLVMLYALRYEKESPVQLMQLFNKLASRSAKYKPGLVQFVLKQAGVDKRTGDLFGKRDLLNIARNMARGVKATGSSHIHCWRDDI
ncbi:hypothetical protein CMV_028026, partial [Castanea mollissima]